VEAAAEDEDEDEGEVEDVAPADAEAPAEAPEAAEAPEPAEDPALCGLLLAPGDALFCESMLCCKVCANGWALAVSADVPVGELPTALRSELISESGDMADPVYPVNPLDIRNEPARRSVKRMIERVNRVLIRVRASGMTARR
jgi:hypothetical protein